MGDTLLSGLVCPFGWDPGPAAALWLATSSESAGLGKPELGVLTFGTLNTGVTCVHFQQPLQGVGAREKQQTRDRAALQLCLEASPPFLPTQPW